MTGIFTILTPTFQEINDEVDEEGLIVGEIVDNPVGGNLYRVNSVSNLRKNIDKCNFNFISMLFELYQSIGKDTIEEETLDAVKEWLEMNKPSVKSSDKQ